MERERVGLEEAKAKLEKTVYRLQEELSETKTFYEERLGELQHTISRLQRENAALGSGKRGHGNSFGLNSNHLLSLNRIETITESLNGSSVGLNGTSLEDIKELTLNMKVPASFNKKTKTEAEGSSQLE